MEERKRKNEQMSFDYYQSIHVQGWNMEITNTRIKLEQVFNRYSCLGRHIKQWQLAPGICRSITTEASRVPTSPSDNLKR